MEAGPFRKRRLFKLELVKESDGDIAQGSENILGGGAEAAVEGVLFHTSGFGVTSHHGKGEQVEPAFQGDAAVQLISQDGNEFNAISRRPGSRRPDMLAVLTFVLRIADFRIRFRP